jgi:hypothetical protein
MLRGDLQRISWEAVFTRASVKASDPPARAPVRVTRGVIDARVEVSRAHSRPPVGESVCGDDVAAGVVRRALEQGSGGKIEWKLQRGVRATGQPGAAGPTVVHVVGTVIEDNAGRGLQLTPVRAYGSQVAPRRSLLPSEAPSNVPVGSTPDQIVRADDLAAAYKDAQLFILQGYPVEEMSERVGSDREAANRTRSFAADLARSGAAVIVIPPLEPAKATEVWVIVNKAAAAFVRRGAVAILPSLTKAQEVILTTRRKKDGWERALDLCVFEGPSAADRRRTVSAYHAES